MPSPRSEQDAGSAPGQLRDVVEPLVREAGFDLEDLEVRAAGRRHAVKIVVDSDAGVGLDDIAMLSRAASDELDQHEHLLGGSYTLEVTSPGVDRPLTGPRHWRRAHLRQVAVPIRAEDDLEPVLADVRLDVVRTRVVQFADGRRRPETALRCCSRSRRSRRARSA